MTRRVCTFAFALLAGCTSGPVVDDAGLSDAGAPVDDDAGVVDPCTDPPTLTVAPLACDFSEVTTDGLGLCEVTIANPGCRDVSVDVFRFSENTPLAVNESGNFSTDEAGFGSLSAVDVPFALAAGSSTTATLFVRHHLLGTLEGALIVQGTSESGADDPANPDVPVAVEVPLTSTREMVVDLGIFLVNGAPYVEGEPIHPLDDVVLQGSQCPDPTDQTVPTCGWWIVERPENSTAELTTAANAMTQLSFHSAAGTVTGVDVAGHYVFGFTVIYPDGSSTEAALSLDVVPWPGLAVELTWDSPSGDVDLWLMKDSTDGCAPETCISGLCQVSSTTTPPEWDGVPGFTDGDPAFAITDLSGYGPEHLRVVEPTDGVYRVGAFASGTSDNGVPTTVRVFMDGETVHASTIALSHHDWAEFAEFTIANGVVVDATTIGDVTPAWSCP